MAIATPNYELLKDAYAIIDGIPDEAFKLSNVITSAADRHDCGTVACAAGWLCIHPTLLRDKINFELFGTGRSPRFEWTNKNGDPLGGYEDAMAFVFGITEDESQSLFASSHVSKYDRQIYSEGGLVVSDKELWKARVRAFLEEKGQL